MSSVALAAPCSPSLKSGALAGRTADASADPAQARATVEQLGHRWRAAGAAALLMNNQSRPGQLEQVRSAEELAQQKSAASAYPLPQAVEGPRLIEQDIRPLRNHSVQALQALPSSGTQNHSAASRYAAVGRNDANTSAAIHEQIALAPNPGQRSRPELEPGYGIHTPGPAFRPELGQGCGAHAASADSKPVLTRHLSVSNEQKLRALFERCDTSGDGSLNKRELIKICRSDQEVAEFFGLPMHIRAEDGSRETFETLFQGIDVNSDREISWDEFRDWFRQKTHHRESVDEHAQSQEGTGTQHSPQTASNEHSKEHSHSDTSHNSRQYAQHADVERALAVDDVPFQSPCSANPPTTSPPVPNSNPAPPLPGVSLRSHASWPAEAPFVTTPSIFESLEQEVAAREVELRVLRVEAAAKEQEALTLRERVRDVDFNVLEASGTVGTLSAKAETNVGNQHAMLEASARRIDSQVVMLRRKLAQMEWDLAEKDEDIAKLQQAVRDNHAALRRQRGELGILQQSQYEQEYHAMQHVFSASTLRRAKAIDDWRNQVQTKLEQESANISLVRDQRDKSDALRLLDEENSTCRAFIVRMEDKIKQRILELERLQSRYEGLLMQDRLCSSAVRLNEEAADQSRHSHAVEQSTLKARIKDEATRRIVQETHAHTYDVHELDAASHQAELLALTSCMREISKALHVGPGGLDDAVDRAMATFLQAAHECGEPLPPVVRIGPIDYLIGQDLVQCVVIQGQLHVRVPGGMLVGIGDFLSSRRRTGQASNSRNATPCFPTQPLSCAATPPRDLGISSSPNWTGGHRGAWSGFPRTMPALIRPTPISSAGPSLNAVY